MPDLPERADIDQLRHQARDLLRAAVAGEPEALARLSAVPGRPTLAAAQLAIAREYGFRSWPALRSEVAGRRQSGDAYPRADPSLRETLDRTPGRRSFGGAETIEVAEGELLPRILVVGPEGAFLEATLVAAEVIADTIPGTRHSLFRLPELRDVTITNDQGLTSTLRSGSGPHPQPGPDQRLRCEVTCALDPVPEGDSRWLDVQGRDTSVTRLLPAAAVPVLVRGFSPVTASPAEQELRVLAWWLLLGYLTTATRDSRDLKRRCRNVLERTAELRESGSADDAVPLSNQLTRLCTSLIRRRQPTGLPSGWHSVLNAAERADGPKLHVDIDTALPPVDGTAVRLNILASWPDSWDLYLQATPGWWRYSADGQHKRDAMSVVAEDDRGGLYISNFGGSSGRPGYEEVKLTMRPRLDPGASLLTLTFAGETQEVAAEISLAP
ncbi:MAG TPA: hypothetical protein VHT26_19015 [Trebonia sp.]|nr:hypothetical protein [Trebonia sp.]